MGTCRGGAAHHSRPSTWPTCGATSTPWQVVRHPARTPLAHAPLCPAVPPPPPRHAMLQSTSGGARASRLSPARPSWPSWGGHRPARRATPPAAARGPRLLRRPYSRPRTTTGTSRAQRRRPLLRPPRPHGRSWRRSTALPGWVRGWVRGWVGPVGAAGAEGLDVAWPGGQGEGRGGAARCGCELGAWGLGADSITMVTRCRRQSAGLQGSGEGGGSQGPSCIRRRCRKECTGGTSTCSCDLRLLH